MRELLEHFTMVSVVVRILLAALMGGLIGSERERHGRAAGLRTHILVCIGAAMTSLTSLFVVQASGLSGDVFRVPAQVISGIGFLGAGMILVRNSAVVTGLTTAAGMWATAAIGVAVGYGFYWGAVCATALCMFTVTVLGRLENKRKKTTYLYAEVSDVMQTGHVVEQVRILLRSSVGVEVLPPKSGCQGHVGLTFSVNEKLVGPELTQQMEQLDHVAFVIEENHL